MKVNEPTRPRTLESLNTDVLIAILSACDSFDDLGSSIRASPTLLHAFLSAKAAVLLRVVGNILGPVTRDAALLAQTSRLNGDDHDRKMDAALQDYRARLRITRAPWVTTMDVKTAVTLTHITRLAQFFTDLYIYFHFRYFAQELGLTQPSLSRAEHRRIAQAVLRRQLLVHIHGGIDLLPSDDPKFARAISSLFRPWELQQISDMDNFLGQLLGSLIDYQLRRRGPNGERIRTGSQFWLTHYAPDIEQFAIKIKSLIELDSSLLDHLYQGEEMIISGRMHLCFSLFEVLQGSHCFMSPPALHDIQESASSVVTADFGQKVRKNSQPWAWKDALQGHNTCRWGSDLVKAPPPDSINQQDYELANTALESWRWFGMAFWDRERAEQLNQSSALRSCKSGWLLRWQN